MGYYKNKAILDNEAKWARARLKQLNIHYLEDVLYHARTAEHEQDVSIFNHVTNAGPYCDSMEDLEDVIRNLMLLIEMLDIERRESYE